MDPHSIRDRDRERESPTHETFDYESLLSNARDDAPATDYGSLFSSQRTQRGGKTLDQRLEGLREHFLPGGVLGGMMLKPEETQVAAIVAEDGTEGSSQRVAEDGRERRVARVISKSTPLRPVRPFVSYWSGADMKLVADPALKKGSVRTWRVNGMVTGDEIKSTLYAEDPRPQRSMLDKLQLASVSEASRKRVLPVAFVEDEYSLKLPPPTVKTSIRVFPADFTKK
jgi:hypothetical protein